MKLPSLPLSSSQPTHLLLHIVEIPPPKSFPISHFPPSHHPHPGCQSISLLLLLFPAWFPSPFHFLPGQPEPSFILQISPASAFLQILPKLDFPIAVVSGTGTQTRAVNEDDPPGCGKKDKNFLSVYFLSHLFGELYFWMCFLVQVPWEQSLR